VATELAESVEVFAAPVAVMRLVNGPTNGLNNGLRYTSVTVCELMVMKGYRVSKLPLAGGARRHSGHSVGVVAKMRCQVCFEFEREVAPAAKEHAGWRGNAQIQQNDRGSTDPGGLTSPVETSAEGEVGEESAEGEVKKRVQVEVELELTTRDG
jgi:hypothetical protein